MKVPTTYLWAAVAAMMLGCIGGGATVAFQVSQVLDQRVSEEPRSIAALPRTLVSDHSAESFVLAIGHNSAAGGVDIQEVTHTGSGAWSMTHKHQLSSGDVKGQIRWLRGWSSLEPFHYLVSGNQDYDTSRGRIMIWKLSEDLSAVQNIFDFLPMTQLSAVANDRFGTPAFMERASGNDPIVLGFVQRAPSGSGTLHLISFPTMDWAATPAYSLTDASASHWTIALTGGAGVAQFDFLPGRGKLDSQSSVFCATSSDTTNTLTIYRFTDSTFTALATAETISLPSGDGAGVGFSFLPVQIEGSLTVSDTLWLAVGRPGHSSNTGSVQFYGYAVSAISAKNGVVPWGITPSVHTVGPTTNIGTGLSIGSGSFFGKSVAWLPPRCGPNSNNAVGPTLVVGSGNTGTGAISLSTVTGVLGDLSGTVCTIFGTNVGLWLEGGAKKGKKQKNKKIAKAGAG